MEKQRTFENIEFDGEYLRVIFTDEHHLFDHYDVDELEAIIFDGKDIEIWCDMNVNSRTHKATQEDFDLLKGALSVSKKFVPCGSNAVFNFDRVVGFSKGSSKNSIEVECKGDYYEVQLNKLEEVNPLVSAIQRRWQKKFTEWDQNRDSSEMEEDTLSR